MIIILIASIQISFLAHASKGLILTSDGRLNYYENDKFVKQVNYFRNISTDFIDLYFTGEYYFLVKKYKNSEMYYLEKWDIKKNKSEIINLNSPDSPITGISLVAKGSGYIQTKNGNLDYYLNGTYIKTVKSMPIEEYESWVSFIFTGNTLYRTLLFDRDSHDYGTVLYKCSKSGDDFKDIDVIYDSDVNFIDFNKNGDGVIIAKSMHIDYSLSLYLYKNNVQVNCIEIDSNEYYNVLSVTDDSIYVDLFSSDDGYFISKCDLNLKNCIKLDMPDKNIVSAYFK